MAWSLKRELHNLEGLFPANMWAKSWCVCGSTDSLGLVRQARAYLDAPIRNGKAR